MLNHNDVRRLAELALRIAEPFPFDQECQVLNAAAQRVLVALKEGELEPIVARILALKRHHYVNEGDCWYSCPASGQCCRDDVGSECDCGATAQNVEIDAIVPLLVPAPPPEGGAG